MRERVSHWRARPKRIASLALCSAKKLVEPRLGKVRDHGTATCGTVEGSVAKETLLLKVSHQARVDFSQELGDAREPAADQLGARLIDEVEHLRLPHTVVRTLNEDQSLLARARCSVEFTLRGRQSLGIFIAVFIAEKANVDRAATHLAQIDFIGPAVGRR